MEKVRTRIAPSPTGYMHIGTLRTILYDYFLARQNGGQFIIRIEDTDQEREVEGAVESLLKTMEKVGIDYDEGPVLLENGTLGEKGEFGPYTQTKRLDIYKKYADELLANGHAYHCFCTKEMLEEMRATQMALKQTPKYDRRCLKLSKEEVDARLAALQPGDAHVIRMRIPEGTSTFTDAIRGDIKFNNADVDDQVIVKSNGIPTYHLAVVVDDHLMEITHVLRGEEWLPSTPKQIILHEMLGWKMPVYAHVPLLLNPDRTKLSKRKGDVAVEQFLAKGYLPQALLSFIATLGFNPKADQEIYTMQEMVELFDLSRVNKSGAVMNLEKLDWMNNHFIRAMSMDELMTYAAPFLNVNVASIRVRRAVEVERERTNRLDELQERVEMYIREPSYDAKMLIWRKADAADAVKQLSGMLNLLKEAPVGTWESAKTLEEYIRAYITKNNLENGNVLWPLRAALSGKERSASPFELLWALEKEESIARIEKGMNLLG